MEKIKIILPKNFKHIVEIMVDGSDEPTVPIYPPIKPPVDTKEPIFPQLQNITFLKDAESINNNSLIPFVYDGDTYLVCHNADNDKSELYNFSQGFKYIHNLDLVMDGSEIRPVVHSITPYKDDYYGLVKYEKEMYLMKYRQGTNLKMWDILGHVEIEGARDTHHDLFINQYGNFLLHGRARNVQDYPGETNQILYDRRSVKQKLYGKTPESVLEPAILNNFIDPIDFPVLLDYLTDQFRMGFYGSRSIVINGKVYTFINVFWQNDKRKTGKRTDRYITGTGDIYPCVIRDYGDVTAWDKNLIDPTPFLRDWAHEHCEGFNPEVGQLHIGGLIDRGDHIEVFFVWRVDTHYLELKGQQATKLFSATLDKKELVKWFDWKEKQAS